MVEVGAVTVTRRGRHEEHEWHFKSIWRQALCDLCLQRTLWHAINAWERINQECGQYFTSITFEMFIYHILTCTLYNVKYSDTDFGIAMEVLSLVA